MKGTEKQLKWARDIIDETGEYIDKQIRYFERLFESIKSDVDYELRLKYWRQCKADFEEMVDNTELAGTIIDAYKRGAFRDYKLEEWVTSQARLERHRMTVEKIEKVKAEMARMEELEVAEEAVKEQTKEQKMEEAVKESMNRLESLGRMYGKFMVDREEYVLIGYPNREDAKPPVPHKRFFTSPAVKLAEVKATPLNGVPVYEIMWSITDVGDVHGGIPQKVTLCKGEYYVF